MLKSKKLRMYLGFIVSGIFLFLVLRKIRFPETVTALRLANYKVIFGASCATLFLGVLRALRWRYLIQNHYLVPSWFFVKAFFVGFLANSALPARLGEIVRAKSLGDLSKGIIKTGGTKSLASIFVERVLDGLILLFIFVALAFIFSFPNWMKKVAYISASISICLFGLNITILVHREGVYKILRKVMSRFNEDLREKMLNMFKWFAEGLGVIKNRRNMIPFLIRSIMIWLLEGLIIYAFITSLNIDAPIISGYFVMILVGFGIAIPSAPAYVGVYQFACIKALSIWGISESISLSFALVMQAVTFVPMNLIGLGILVFSRFSFRNQLTSHSG